MKEHMPFRGTDKIVPSGNGTVIPVESKPRSKTVNSVKEKKRRTVRGTDEDTDGEPSQRRRSLKFDHTLELKDGELLEKSKPLSWRKRLFEFYSAPITTFWLWFLAFVVFMLALIFVLLVETPKEPSWVEWYLFSYVVVWACEVLRKVGFRAFR